MKKSVMFMLLFMLFSIGGCLIEESRYPANAIISSATQNSYKAMITTTFTLSPTRISTITPALTSTPISYVPTEIIPPTLPPSVENEIRISEENIPGDSLGALLIKDTEGYLLVDITTMRTISFLGKQEDKIEIPEWAWATISPDRKYLAYIEVGESGNYLRLINANGEQQPVPKISGDIYLEIIGWLNNNRIMLVEKYNWDDIKYFIVDMELNAVEEFVPNLPIFSDSRIDSIENAAGSPFIACEPTLNDCVITFFEPKNNSATFQLWDIHSQKILWETTTNVIRSRPIWDPGSNSFALIYASLSEKPIDSFFFPEKLHIIGKDGQEKMQADEVGGELSWSPDGRRIAVRRIAPSKYKAEWGLGTPISIVNVENGNTSIYIFKDDEGYTYLSDRYFLWSPDNHYLVFNTADTDITSQDQMPNKLILFSVIDNRAFSLEISGFVLGWLQSP